MAPKIRIDNENKKSLGQFMSTHWSQLLANFQISSNVLKIIEPFAGKGDLLQFIQDPEKYQIQCYDIQPQKDFIEKRNSLTNPPDYDGAFILTNPPYLSRNQTEEKELFDRFKLNDLYKCFLQQLIETPCLGGILILPLNFLSSIRKMDRQLRERFLNLYRIQHLNIFEEPVFDDTTYTVCSFQFSNKQDEEELSQLFASALNLSGEIPVTFYPSGKRTKITLSSENGYTFGGEIYLLSERVKGTFKVSRLVGSRFDPKFSTRLLVKCIDDSEESRINISFVDEEKVYVDRTPKATARSYCSLSIEPAISLERQRRLAIQFNQLFNEYRERYSSLFLPNYRDKGRKRIPFQLVYDLVKFLLEEE